MILAIDQGTSGTMCLVFDHQGELIGRVGSSGLATGPHLDYRLRHNGSYINPVTAHRAMPPADPVPPAQMAAFMIARDSAFGALRNAPIARVSNPDTLK